MGVPGFGASCTVLWALPMVFGHRNARGVTPAASKTHRIGPARVLVLRGKGPKVKIDTQNSKYSIISKIKARAIIEYFEIFEF